jgi:tetratricopeptide (TPR) repeat protein
MAPCRRPIITQTAMRATLRVILMLLSCMASVGAAPRSLELRGRIDPPPARATVSIGGAISTFVATTYADSKGRFRFRKLPPGPYIVSVFVPGAGVTRRSVDVTPGLADESGRVELTIGLSPPPGVRPARGRNTVSVAELAIPERARREFAAAQRRLQKHDADGATAHLRRAVELAPQFMMAYTELGRIALASQHWSDAEEYYRKAFALRPDGLLPVLNLGRALLYLQRWHEALDYNRLAVERSPDNAVANFQLGMNYLGLKRDEEALKYLRLSKTIDPSQYASPQLVMADIFSRRGDRASAIAELQDFLARHPDAPDAPRVRDEISGLKSH